MIKLRLIVVIIVLLNSTQLNAQSKKFPYSDLTSYNHYLSTEFGITSTPPENFVGLNRFFVLRRVQQDPSKGQVGSMYGPIFQTRDEQGVVMYAGMPHYQSESDTSSTRFAAAINRAKKGNTSPLCKSELPDPRKLNNQFPRSQITTEVKAASGLYDYKGKPLKDSVRFNFNDHVTIITGRKAKEMFNADSIYIYDLPLQEPYKENYTYRTGVVLAKKDRATMLFKFFFTPQGKKDEEKYIKMLAKHIWYEEGFEPPEE